MTTETVSTKTTDMFSPDKRSAIMRAVKGAGAGPERRLAAAFARLGLAPRTNDASLPGSPDFVFPRARLAVFVHGCFWHGHDCARGARAPKTNAAYWAAKIARNVARDHTSARALRKLGYSVSTLWECRLKDPDRAAARIARRLQRQRAERPAGQTL